MKNLITTLLLAALTALPLTSRAPEPPPPDPQFVALAELCCIEMVFGCIILAVAHDCYIRCKYPPPIEMTSPPPDGFPPFSPPPPPTNAPPKPGSNAPPKVSLVGDASTSPNMNLTGMGVMDTNGPVSCEFTNLMSCMLQSASPIDGGFTDLVRLSVWQSSAGRLVEASRDGQALWTDYAPFVAGRTTNHIVLPTLIPKDDQRYFRMLSK